MKMHRISGILPLLALLFLVSSCSKDNLVLEETLYNTDKGLVDISEDDNNVNIRIESLLNSPFAIVAFDHNNNSQIDSLVDFAYGFLNDQYDFCGTYLIRPNAMSGCGALSTNGTFLAQQTTTEFDSTEHYVFDLSIPKNELDDSGELRFMVKVYGSEYNNFPENPLPDPLEFSFKNTFTVFWK